MSFLSKDRTIAPPGYSRWMIPPAALCVHLCIGQAYAFSVFNLPMTKLLGITQSSPGDWKLTDIGWIFSLAIFVLGFLGGSAGPLGRGSRPAQGDVRGGLVLERRLHRLRHRRLYPQYLGDLFRLRRPGRLRARHRLYLAGLDPDQMVSRPSGHGDRHGDHGIRRRCLHRLAAVGVADGAASRPRPMSAWPRPSSRWAWILWLFSCWWGRRSCACRHPLEARGLDRAGAAQEACHPPTSMSTTR